MSIGRSVVRAVALQQIDYAPHGKARAQGHNKGLQSSNSGREELHISSVSPGSGPGHEKSRLGRRQVTSSGHTGQKLYKSVRVVQVVIVEDVLVLFHVAPVRHVHLVHGIFLAGVQLFHTPPDEPGEVKGVFLLVGLGGVFVVGVLFQILLATVGMAGAANLQ